DGVAVFKGVRYGRLAPRGRWQRALEPESWTGVRVAGDYGPRCPQPRAQREHFSPYMPMLPPSVQPKVFDEDCLVLNVWSPRVDETARLPVMVWIHGGGYFRGSGESPWTNGAKLARRGDAVVVTVNHRLGVFGYLHLTELGGDDLAVSGNVGNLDLVAALEWVRDNIAGFGGDPSRVMIFGC